MKGGEIDVAYTNIEKGSSVNMRYGIVDEESKLNINYATRNELTRLIKAVTSQTDQKIENIVNGILGWRAPGDAELIGFQSDDYYTNLDDPYESKHAEFELVEELLLVHGVDQDIFDEVEPYITVYGDGKVNVGLDDAAYRLEPHRNV